MNGNEPNGGAMSSIDPTDGYGGDDIIEDYLDDLFARLNGPPRAVRRMLAETEQHLCASADDAIAQGVEPRAAAAEAVARFGSAAHVARTWSSDARRAGLASSPWLVRHAATQLLPLAGVGLVAVGLSGLVARLMTTLWGATFVFADAPGTSYPASACRYWLSLHPNAGTCGRAYLAETVADDLFQRYAAGVLGVAILAGVAVHRRRGRTAVFRPPTLPAAFTGAVLFLSATVAMAALGFDALRVSNGHGAGQWLSAAAVAGPLAAAFAAVAVSRSGRPWDRRSGFGRRHRSPLPS